VRRLCGECKEPQPANVAEKSILGFAEEEAVTIYRPAGCPHCNYTGYRGRTGIHELLVVNEVVRELIHTGAGEQAVEREIRKTSSSIREDGIQKVLLGQTTLEEILRVTRED